MKNEAGEREPGRGEVWEFTHTGGLFAIVGRATDLDAQGDPGGHVVYRKLHHGEYYVRSLPSFLSKFTYKYGPKATVAAEAEGVAR